MNTFNETVTTLSHSHADSMLPAYRRLLGCKRVLLLQGPMGGFFNRLADWLESHGVEVRKINFNGGDWFFHRHLNAVNYWGTLGAFPSFLARHIGANRIGGLVCFGDCRHYHRAAARVAESIGMPLFVFEEGYIRPEYITLEDGGVNMNSPLPRDIGFYRSLPDQAVPQPLPTKTSFMKAAASAAAYYLAARALRFRYPNYRHHRIFSVSYELRAWTRSLMRKLANGWRDRPVFRRLVNDFSGKYFTSVLQVYYDSQIHHHSDFKDVREFIEEVLFSFARHADGESHLVFKHHPMDRGNRDYRRQIESLSAMNGLAGRVHYLHDVHLPTLLRHSRGVITVNSSVGLSAIYHGKPLIVLGRAFYDFPGLTFQGELKDYWHHQNQVDAALWHRFRAFLIAQTQINASYYGRDFLDLLSRMDSSKEDAGESPAA